MASIADIPPAVTTADRIDLPVEARQRGFWIGLCFALFLHSLLLVGIRHAAPRTVGDPSGAQDAIAVELVTEADLQSRETVALPPGSPSSTTTAATPPPQPEMKAAPEPQPEQPVEKTAPETPKETPAPEPKTETVPAEPKKETPAADAQKESLDPSFDLPDLTSLEELAKQKQDKDPTKTKAEEQRPEAKPLEPKPKAEQAPKKPASKPAPKDQAPQMSMAMPPPSGGISRPPGITRSGENDEFGRGVIRALRATMPPPMGKYGRVTVRLLLTERGDLSEVKLLESSGSGQLDQSVVFATQQTNFPLPPRGATVADRTFIISYVYRLDGPR